MDQVDRKPSHARKTVFTTAVRLSIGKEGRRRVLVPLLSQAVVRLRVLPANHHCLHDTAGVRFRAVPHRVSRPHPACHAHDGMAQGG